MIKPTGKAAALLKNDPRAVDHGNGTVSVSRPDSGAIFQRWPKAHAPSFGMAGKQESIEGDGEMGRQASGMGGGMPMGLSDNEFRKFFPGPEAAGYGADAVNPWSRRQKQREWDNMRINSVAPYLASTRAKQEQGWNEFLDNQRADRQNLLATQMARNASENAPQQIPQLAQAPLAQAGNGSTGMGMGPTNRGGFLPGEDDFYSRRLKDLISNPGSFTGTPGFKFALDNGRQAIERSFAAKGMGNSGNVLSELMKYGTGLASQEYGNRVNELSGLASREPPTWAMRGRY